MARQTAGAAIARPDRWTSLHIALHWAVVGLVLVQFLLGPSMAVYFQGPEPGETISGPTMRLAWVHGLVGVAIFVAMALRLWDIRKHGRPPRSQKPAWATALAVTTQFLLYAVLLLMPVVGITALLTGSKVVAAVHALSAFLLLPLVALHVSGALAEKFWFKTEAFDRMVPGAGRKT